MEPGEDACQLRVTPGHETSDIGPLECWKALFARRRRAERMTFVIDPRDGSAAAPDNHA